MVGTLVTSNIYLSQDFSPAQATLSIVVFCFSSSLTCGILSFADHTFFLTFVYCFICILKSIFNTLWGSCGAFCSHFTSRPLSGNSLPIGKAPQRGMGQLGAKIYCASRSAQHQHPPNTQIG